ncbi:MULTISPECIES: hypothetical protein [Dactylosporangium]|uniref:Uncharacterized protein n=2 Tax=Dactylosporangium TaxID=35753 RepID=A0A9W6KBF6_9ACTN|nr:MULTISPECIES: hypothetical protein [Dactylosporangium]UAB96720.1 hypothetical protein Dvina_00245 [Dactylosporangium vinaceum]UWZ45048.1 hypothetical protein Dmats_00255 [Dactylosporangium matsuzakiense]GLK99025.1 hypothetical protein GCM10017581_007660 [Dactylosporangium matsuzakiense]
MNIGPENFGNGSSKTDDRFSGQLGSYRPGGRRDGLGDGPLDDLSPRNGSPLDRASMPLDMTPPKLPESSLVADLGPLTGGSLSSGSLGSNALDGPLTEPMFGRDSWLDTPSGASMADHPLLRGLLMELPPKGTMPQQEWLDRWFEAARSILELIYSQESRQLK